MNDDPTYMSEERQRVSIAAVFGSQEKEAVTPLPRPVLDAIAYAERAGFGPLAASRVTDGTLELAFTNGRKAIWRPDPRFLVSAYGSPKVAEVIRGRPEWAEQLRIDQRK